MGLMISPSLSSPLWSWRDSDAYWDGWCDEDDTLRTGVDDIQTWYVADMLAVRKAADELRFADWVRSQCVAG